MQTSNHWWDHTPSNFACGVFPEGKNLAARVQEFILEEAAAVDARVALLEAAYMMVTIQAGRELTAGEPSHRVPVPRVEPRRPVAPSISAESWEQLDHIDLGEAFTTRVPMLRSCSRFLRRRLRFSLGVALRERSRAMLARELRARRPQESLSPISREVMDFVAQSPLSLDGKIFAKCLRKFPWFRRVK